MRLFIAIYPPEAVQAQITEWGQRCASALARQSMEVNYSKAQNMHITLKFLGETPDDRLNPLTERLNGVLRDFPSFQLSLGSVRPFPDQGEIKMIWLQLAGNLDSLNHLAFETDRACAELGFKPESRSFTPHLTVGRVKSVRGSAKIRSIVAQLPACQQTPFCVNRVSVVRSILSPSGPTYTALRDVQLSLKV